MALNNVFFKINFKDSASSLADALIILHNDLLFYLIVILIFVVAFIFRILHLFLWRDGTSMPLFSV